MAAERLSMRRVREILRYRFVEGLGHKVISYRVGAAPSTVRETLRRAAAAGLMWPLDEAMTDAVLEAALYKASGKKTGHRRGVPDCLGVDRIVLRSTHEGADKVRVDETRLPPSGLEQAEPCCTEACRAA
jgi:hypothetical protein